MLCDLKVECVLSHVREEVSCALRESIFLFFVDRVLAVTSTNANQLFADLYINN